MNRSVSRNSGQVLLVVLVAIVVLIVAALWLADVHYIVFSKNKTQSAGDAAALEGARWQGTTLNLIGELNLLHVLALATENTAAEAAITNAQARILFAGPLTGAAAAQQAAKLNGSPVNDDFTEFLRECAHNVRSEYNHQINGDSAFPPPWPGAWGEYARMLDAIAADGVAAGIDNAAFYTDSYGSHTLLLEPFYSAVRGRDWCWFLHYAPGLLEEYNGFSWWPALPDQPEDPPISPELLGLQLRTASYRLGPLLKNEALQESLQDETLSVPVVPDTVPLYDRVGTWIAFQEGSWGRWEIMRDPVFPLEGDLREEYDYSGADSVMRVENTVRRLTEDAAHADPVVWIGAAKPFGYLDGGEGKEVPTASPFVLPVFRDVRLIPLDASSSPSGGSFNLRWRKHCRQHLPPYMDRGVSALVAGCRYCQALRLWEKDLFREQGRKWLSTNSWKCTVCPPGGSSGGGSYHAH